MSQTITPSPAPVRPLAAAAWMLSSVLAFTAVAVAGREVSQFYDTFETMTWRSLVSLVVLVAILAVRRQFNVVKTQRLGLHILRNIMHFAGQNLWFLAISLIPLAQVFALEFTAPLWVILLAPLFLGESLTRIKLLTSVLGFAGAIIVAKPDFNTLDLGVVAAAAAAVCFAGTALFTKNLTRTDSVLTILFWLTLMQLVMGFICSIWDGDFAPLEPTSALWFLLMGLAGLTAHFCLTKSLSLAPASVVMPLDFARLPVAALAGWLLWSEVVGWNVWLGGIIIIGAITINLRANKTADTDKKNNDNR